MRKNPERVAELQPHRMQDARDMLEQLNIPITFEDETTIKFTFNGNTITYFPYTGWHTGKGIKDGRGIANLYKQLKPC